MICGVMQVNRWTEEQKLFTPLQSTARREDCKDKDPTKVIELHQNWLGTRGKEGGVSENKCSAMPCALRCYFSHLCFSLAYDYFTINDVVKQMKWMLLLLYFRPNVKKSFLLKVSSVDSQKMITKYPLVGAWQMQKKRILNIILYLLALLLLR